MKHLLLILGLTITCTLSAAELPARTAGAYFYASGPFEMSITIDGYLVNRHPRGWVETNLRPGNHIVRIKAYGPRGVKYLTRSIYVRAGAVNQYRISSPGPFAGLYMDYENTIHRQYRRPAYHTTVVVYKGGNHYGHVKGHHNGYKKGHHNGYKYKNGQSGNDYKGKKREDYIRDDRDVDRGPRDRRGGD